MADLVEIKEILQEIFAIVLGLQREDLGNTETFEDLGIGSVNAVQLLEAINTKFNLTLPTSVVFECNTIDALAKYVESHLKDDIYNQQEEEQNFQITSNRVQDIGEIKESLGDIFIMVLGIHHEELAESKIFKDLGIGSINAVQLLEAINSKFDLTLPTSVVFECNTLDELANYIGSHIQEHNIQESIKFGQEIYTTKETHFREPYIKGEFDEKFIYKDGNYLNLIGQKLFDDIAIIGLSCRCAGANGQDEFWDMVSQGKDCIQEIENQSWLDFFKLNSSDKIPTRYGAMAGIEYFDPLFFKISPKEAALMDVAQRILLEESYKALEDAGYIPSELQGKPVGTIIGTMGSAPVAQDFSHFSMLGSDTSILAARIAYYLDLKGPSLAINTACSSSLVAIDIACQKLKNCEIDLAIAGGITIYSHPGTFISMNNAGMLSPSAECRPFDNAANGIVVGDGVGIVILKRLQEAIQDNDYIYGVIRGSGTNQDGQTSGITVPSFQAQSQLQESVYRKNRIDVEDIQYIEAHGTATKLGDPIEIHALTNTFIKFTTKKRFCAIGSLKANIGHTTAAAGVLNVIKVLLSMKHQKMPPSINFNKENEHIDFENSPVYVNTALKEWPVNAKGSRLAAVNSFGFSGTNAHVVIEEYAGKNRESTGAINQSSPGLLVLSSDYQEGLRLYAKKIREYVQVHNDLNLTDLLYTFQVARESMSYRLALVTSSKEMLITQLEQFIEGHVIKSTDGYVGKISKKDGINISDTEEGKEFIRNLVQHKKIKKLAEFWTSGNQIDWKTLYWNGSVKRLPGLPTYPFARECYPISESNTNSGIAMSPAVAAFPGLNPLHPLLHQNTSDFFEQRFSTTFTGREIFLTDHVVKGQRVLPGVTYLEMARAAVQLATGGLEEGRSGIRLTNVVWVRPITVGDQAVRVHIGLFPEDNTYFKDGGKIAFEIYSKHEKTAEEPIVYSQGSATLNVVTKIPTLELKVLRDQCNQNYLSAAQCYEIFKAKGLNYGPGFQGIDAVYVGSDQVLAKISLPDSVSDTKDQFALHPSLMDSALQASLGLMIGTGEQKLSLPFALQALEIFGNCTSVMWASVRYSASSKTGDKLQKFDIDICDEHGNIHIRMTGFSFRVLESELGAGISEKESLTQKDTHKFGTLMFEPMWKEQTVAKGTLVPDYTQHLVILFELENVSPKNIENQMKMGTHACRCLSVQSRQNGIAERFQTYVVQVFEEIQRIFKDKSNDKVLVQIVVYTQHEQQLFSGLLGLLKTAQLENPKLIGQLIEVEPTENSTEIIKKLKENSRNPLDNWVRYQDGKRWVAGLRELEVSLEGSSLEQTGILWKDQGIYLITGGIGGLGLIFSKEIVQKVKNPILILTGRSSLDEKKKAQLNELEAMGARIAYKQVDVTKKEAITNLIHSIRKDFGNLHGIIHSAGVIRDNFILKKTKEELLEVLEPKVNGLVYLDQASKDLNLDFFIVFSSAAGIFGNPGQADYSAANAFMDAYVRYRNSLAASKQRHGRTLSINWPLWKEGGMHVDEETEKMLMQTMGMIAMETSTGIRAFYQSFASGHEQVMVMEGDLAFVKQKLLPLSNTAIPLSTSRNMSDTGNLIEKVHMILIQTLSQLLKVNSEDIDVNSDFKEYGLDQFMLTKFANKLNQEYSLELTPTVFFEYTSLHSFAEYLLAEYRDIFNKLFGMDVIKKHLIVEENKRVPIVTEELLRDKAVNYFKRLLSTVIKLPADRIEANVPMEKYGIDSIMVMQLTNQLEKIFGSLSKTLFFEYQNIHELTDYFVRSYRSQMIYILGIEEKAAATVEKVEDLVSGYPHIALSEPVKSEVGDRRARLSQKRFAQVLNESSVEKATGALDIAIIGVSGRYPGAGNIQEFWKNLRDGKDCITEIPKDRWDHSLYFDEDKNKPGKTYSKWGGFLDEVDKFDPLFFNISPREAEMMDPQERLFLECVYEALEDSGYTRESLSSYKGLGLKGNVGVFVGVMYEEYQLYGAQEQIQCRPIALYGNPASIANRVSYFCNFHGPSMAIDTMCSSSLTAIHLACQSLVHNGCELAIAGGVNVSIHPNKYLMLGQGKFVSSKGRCESFGQGGDGYVPGEGVGAVLLKPISKAIADGDHIYGIIKATAINHGGKANGYTVPNPNAQAGVIVQAYKGAGINPRTVSYIEAHGTGTSLGDPIEIAGLTKAFQGYTKDKQFCAIGSAKSNIGHCESAAGIAGVTKVLLQLKNGQLAPSLHSKTLNPNIDFGNIPFVVQQELAEWKRPLLEINGERMEYPRIAGISSFGAGGSNAHVVIEEYIPKVQVQPQITTTPQNPAIIVLSAKNEERLKEQAQRLLTALEERQFIDTSLTNIAYTLQVGREAMEERMAIIVSSLKELEEKLKAFVEGLENITDLYHGQVKRNKETLNVFTADDDIQKAIDAWINKKKYAKLLDSWVKGLHFDWNKLYSDVKPHRISMPTYPFAKERYWVPKTEIKSTNAMALTSVMTGQNAIGEKAKTSTEPMTNSSLNDPLVGNIMLAPVWDVTPLEKGQTLPASTDNVIIIGGTDVNKNSIQQYLPQAQALEIGSADSVDEIAKKLEVNGSIDHIIWVDSYHSIASMKDEALIEEQNIGVFQVFKIIKALLRLGYDTNDLGLSIMTTQTQAIHKEDAVNPTHASIHGLIGSLSKEYPNWKIRLVDLGANSSSGEPWPLADILTLPPDPQGNAWVYRSGEWYRQRLIPYKCPPLNRSLYRNGGVYVVIGGAGGIGEAWSEYMIKNYQAQIVWIGRRQKDEAIQAKLDKLSVLGTAPIYIATDATDRKDLQQAYEEIKQHYSEIHGVIHAAIALLDQSLGNMDEERFRAGLAAKVDVSVRMAQVFYKEPLDFVIFFSSTNSFAKSPGQSNYVAGCTFKDALAHQLSIEWPCAVKVMNWGYWGSIGVAASETYRERMARSGWGSIELPEAMEAIEVLLAGPLDQFAFLKTTKPLAMEEINAEELVIVEPGDPNRVIRQKLQTKLKAFTASGTNIDINSQKTMISAKIRDVKFTKIPQKEIDKLSNAYLRTGVFSDSYGLLVLNMFQSMGFLENTEQKTDVKFLYEKYGYSAHLNLLLNTSLLILKKRELIEFKEGSIFLSETGNSIETRERAQGVIQRFEVLNRILPELSPHLLLLNHCIENYPAVLNGKISSEELFRAKRILDWSKEIVTLNNKWDDPFGKYIRQSISQIPSLFKTNKECIIVNLNWMGDPFSRTILEYVNTNEQKAKYFYIEGSPVYQELINKAFQNNLPALKNELSYIEFYPSKDEKDILEKIPAQKADLIIVQDVHSDIRKTAHQLTLVKEMMKPNGYILSGDHPLISEVLALTFGLIEDRLLCQTEPDLFDKHLSRSSVFNKFGFQMESIFGEWLTVGWKESEGNIPGTITENPIAEETGDSDVTAFLIKSFSNLLGVVEKDLDIDTNLQDYGLDSITISRAYILIQKEYGKVLSAQDMVTYSTVKQLADLIKKQGEKSKRVDRSEEKQKAESLLIESITNIDQIEEKTVISSETQNEGITVELISSNDLNVKDRKPNIQFDENSRQTGYFKTSSDRTYEIVTFGEGPAIMFLTGLAFTWKVWRHQIPFLQKQYRLIFPHFPGHGRSVSQSGEFTFEDISDDLLEILNYYQIDASHMVGWCMGGNIAQLFAARYPKKIKSLVLVGTTPTDARVRGVNTEDLTDYAVDPLFTYILEFRNCLKQFPFQDYFSELFLEYLKDSYCPINNLYVLNYVSNLFQFDSLNLLKDITSPTLVIAGKWDIAFPTDQVGLLHQGISGSKYFEFDQSGHLPFLTQHDLFNHELIKFLLVKRNNKDGQIIRNKG